MANLELGLLTFVVPIVLRVLAAIAIVYLGRAIARRTRPAVERFLRKPNIAETVGATMVKQVARLAYGLILGTAIFLALAVLGIPVSYLVTSVGVIVVILAVALQQSLANFAATVIFVMYEPFRKGELIQTMDYVGTVIEIQLFNTLLLLADQRQVSLPNQKIQELGVINFTRKGVLRADIEFVVGYGADLEKVRSILLAIAAADGRTLAEPPADVYILGMSDNGVRVALRVFVEGSDYWRVLSDMRSVGKSALEEARIGFAEYKYSVDDGKAPPPLPAPATDAAQGL